MNVRERIAIRWSMKISLQYLFCFYFCVNISFADVDEWSPWLMSDRRMLKRDLQCWRSVSNVEVGLQCWRRWRWELESWYVGPHVATNARCTHRFTGLCETWCCWGSRNSIPNFLPQRTATWPAPWVGVLSSFITAPHLSFCFYRHQKRVILKVLLSNICGSDQHMVRGRTTAPSGLVLGHEITGEVIELGRDVEFVKKGDIVSVPFNIACGRCINCKRGLTGICLTVNPARPGAAYGYVDMGRAGKPSTWWSHTLISICWIWDPRKLPWKNLKIWLF